MSTRIEHEPKRKRRDARVRSRATLIIHSRCHFFSLLPPFATVDQKNDQNVYRTWKLHLQREHDRCEQQVAVRAEEERGDRSAGTQGQVSTMSE